MIVLPDHHVVAAAGLYKEDGCHTTEAVGSHTGFTAVAQGGGWGTHFERVRVDFAHLELGFKDSRGQDATAKPGLGGLAGSQRA